MESAPVTPTTPSVQDTTHEAAQTTAEETSVAKAKSPSVGRWMTLTTSISNTANHKIDITIGRLTFIISIIAMIVAVLSYSYGAASYHIAHSAYRLQQLEFCKEHGDDPVSVLISVLHTWKIPSGETYGSAASRSVEPLPASDP
ncbi:MAG: hypothetical protein Q9198_003814 [Flavoplaca austrocitrina]